MYKRQRHAHAHFFADGDDGVEEVLVVLQQLLLVDVPVSYTHLEDGSFTEIEGSEKLYPADSVIISISQGPRNRIVSTTKGLEANARGLLVADDHGRTTRPGIFASGDVVKGARTVVEAVAFSKKVAEAMDEYMQSLPKEEKSDSPEIVSEV